MGIISYIKQGASSTAGYLAGKFVLPAYVAPVIRGATSYLWGPATGFLGSMAKRTAVENAGNIAFNVTQAYGGPVGAAMAVGATELATRGIKYGVDCLSDYRHEQKLKTEVNEIRDKIETETPGLFFTQMKSKTGGYQVKAYLTEELEDGWNLIQEVSSTSKLKI